MLWDVLCYLLRFVSLVVLRGLGRFLYRILQMTGFPLTWSLLPSFLEHCVRCDGLFGVSLDVRFGLCHLD